MSIQTDTGNGTPVLFEARNVVVERNTSLAMLLWGATANLDAMVIRDTFPQPSNGDLGRALSVEYDYLFNHRAAVTVTSSVIRNHSEFGIIAGGSDLVVDATTVGDIWPEAQSQKFGRCIQAQDESAQPPSVTITHSLLERCHDVGLNVAGGLLLTESLWIRDVLPKALDQRAGRGINIQMSSSEPLTGTATVRDSRVERSVEMGVAILDSVATVEHTLIFATAARADALFGDGIDVFTLGSPAAVQIVASRIEQGARAGVASFGAHVSLADTQIYCHGFDLNGESHAGQPHLFEDLGGNECGCGEPVDCTLDTATLQPPEPLEDAP
jgi:hypothetical protein